MMAAMGQLVSKRGRAPATEEVLRAYREHFQVLESEKGFYLTAWDEGYPKSLSQIKDPPHGLSGLGSRQLLNTPMVAVVGSRQANPKVLQMSFEVGRWLGALGVTVVSGGALGVDMAAHRGAMAHSPFLTIVVQASGLLNLTPRSHLLDFTRVIRGGGLLLSERLMTTRARPFDFPVRNRIISGLCQAVIVMACEFPSGTYKTADLALDQGREVLVYADPLGVEASGNRRLIFDGASAFCTLSDLRLLVEGLGIL